MLAVAPLEAQTAPTVEILSESHQTVELELAEGTLVGGHHGGKHSACAGSTRAFLALFDPNGQEIWHRTQAPLDSLCTDPSAAALFDGFAGLDPGHVVASKIHDAELTTDGDLLVVGELRLAWRAAIDDALTASTVAFVGRWTTAGIFVAGQLVGTLPDGPPFGGANCEMICTTAREGGDAVVARLLVADAHGVTVSGWQRPTVAGGPPAPRDQWSARFDSALATLAWSHTSGTVGDDESLEMIVDPAGNTLVSGLGQDDPGRLDHQVTLTRILADGSLGRRIVFGGPLDDRPQGLVLEPSGDIVISGTFYDQITLAGQTLGLPGSGKQGFRARLDSELEWISAQQVTLPGQGGQSFAPRRRPTGERHRLAWRSGDNHPAIPTAYQVTSGSEQRGQIEQIEASDNDYLRIVADADDLIALQVLFDPDPMDRETLYLDSVRVEIGTLFCYQARVLVKGMVSQDFVVAGERSLCPSDEPILEIQIPDDFSAALGYDGSTIVDPQHRLVVALEIRFDQKAPDKQGATKGAGAEEDASVDHIEVVVEY